MRDSAMGKESAKSVPRTWHVVCNLASVPLSYSNVRKDGVTGKAPLLSLRVVSLVWVICLAPIVFGCSKIPATHAAVDSIKMEGNEALSERELEKRLATRETPRLLGIVQGVFFDYRLYNHYVLQMDIQRIERLYRSRGYYHARVRSVQVVFRKKNHVRIRIEIEEGPPTIVSQLRIRGLGHLPYDERRLIRKAIGRRIGVRRVFDQDEFKDAASAAIYELRSLGFAYAEIERAAKVDLPNKKASVSFQVTTFDKVTYGPILIEGLPKGIPEKMVRRALMLTEGKQYSQRKIEDAQQAALALGVFSSVQIEPQLSERGPTKSVPIVVRVEPTSLHTVELGAGVQLDVIRAATYGLAGYRVQNFLGGLRDLRLRVKPGVVFFPTRLQSLVPPTDILPMVKARATLKQPQIFEARTDGVLRGDFNMYPLLLSPHIDERAPVLGYREVEGGAALERLIGRHLFLSPVYTLQWATPFAYKGQLDPDLHPLVISAVELNARWDTRDDPVFPSRGFAVSTGVQYAGLGADVYDVRMTPEVRAYIPLGGKFTLATRASTGLLFPQNWGDSLKATDGTPPAAVSRAEWVRDAQISLFRSFFAGGPSSNRGYAARGIGPHGIIPFFVPELQSPEAAAECEADPTADPAQCLLPLGGRTLWEANIELRFPIAGDLHGVVFCDAADAAPRILEFRFKRPHLSCGLGARYSTPVGPIRFDVGYRIPGVQVFGDSTGEGVPPDFLGIPIALALSIGEAF
jgi:outer membrane protein assembly factor BamA